jgi:hypothetical protein
MNQLSVATVLWKSLFLALWIVVAAQAGSIDFGTNPISFTPPFIIAGPGTITSVDPPSLTPLLDGYEISGPSLTVSATGTGTIDIGYDFFRDFLADDPPIKVTIKGQKDVSPTGGVVTVNVIGTIDGLAAVTFVSPPVTGAVPPPVATIPYNVTGPVINVAPGVHTLDKEVRIRWTGFAAGDALMVSNPIDRITITVIPEPTTFLFLCAGLSIIGWGRYCRK